MHISGHSVAIWTHTWDEQHHLEWICVHTYKYISIVCVRLSASGLMLQGLLCRAFWGWSFETLGRDTRAALANDLLALAQPSSEPAVTPCLAAQVLAEMASWPHAPASALSSSGPTHLSSPCPPPKHST